MSSSVRAAVKRGGRVRPLVQVCILLLFATGTSMIVGESQEARAQEADSACAETLATAEEAYRNRDYDRAVSLASQCTDQSTVEDSTAIRAHRVITLASLRQGTLTQARSAVRNILKIDPEYTADSVNDPPSYNLFVSRMRKRVDIAEAAGEEEEAPAQDEAEEEAPEETADEPTERDPSRAPPRGSVASFFLKPFGIGVADYTGDMPAQNASHPFDFQEFNRGSGFPFMLHGELGYQFAPRWALVLGMQVGNYPIIGYNTGDQSISDSWRYTPQLLIRHAFGPLGETTVFYLDVGANATFGGKGIAKTGYGPVIGGGVDIPLGSAVSLYVESRFNFTLPDDAIDGSVASEFAENADDFENVQDSVTGSFDSVNQLLGLGLRVRF